MLRFFDMIPLERYELSLIEYTRDLKDITVRFILVLLQKVLKLIDATRLANIGQSLASFPCIKDKFLKFAVRNRYSLILIVIYANDRGTIFFG